MLIPLTIFHMLPFRSLFLKETHPDFVNFSNLRNRIVDYNDLKVMTINYHV